MKFKCKHTGNVVEFKEDHDIQAMLDHPEYEVVKEDDVVEVKVTKTKQKSE